MDTHTTHDVERRAASTQEVIEGLNDLLKLDHDAIGAYDIAIEKLENRENADQIAGFRADHERHIRDLNQLIAELGGTATNEPHATGPFKEALQSLGGLAGDKGVLLAWRTNELQVRTKYDSYASRANAWPSNAKRIVDRNALDEERHYEWVIRVLQQMGISSGDDFETNAATRLREAGAQVENLTHRARHAASEAASTARNRIASGLDAAGDRVEDLTEERTEPGARAGEVGHRVASGLHGSASYVRDADLERLREDLEYSAQNHPVRTLAVLFATGFVIGRLLR